MKKSDFIRTILYLTVVYAVTGAFYFFLYRSGGIKNAGLFAAVTGTCSFIPGLTALVMNRLTRKENRVFTGYRPGPAKFYSVVYIMGPMIFVVAYGLSLFAGGRCDFELTAFSETLKHSALKDLSAAESLKRIFITSLTISVLIKTIPGLAMEYGWRGYLQELLRPFGRIQSYILTGICWGISLVPLVWMGRYYKGSPIAGTGMILLFCITFSVLLGHLKTVTGSSILCGFAQGVFGAQTAGVWVLIITGLNPLIGGIYGLAGVIVLLLIAVLFIKFRPE